MINSIMDSIIWLAILLPVSYLHGHLTGRSQGIRLGAAQMYDEIWRNGTVTSKRGVRTVELENELDQ